ncbi:MAG: aminoacetone oxidase family FAD-binding enzyme [Clostridia bacterium]|nr:aminoacetone oxidase family FAD-binding enzyme [Clostridia bacterium]
MKYDVCIIGGGAAGLAAAVYIKQNNSNISVAVLERLNRVGKKLITTGNGRCNITNRDEALSHYHGEQSGFAEYALSEYDNIRIAVFFKSLGVPFYCDEKGRFYPASLQASSIVDALRFSADTLGVDTFTECKVTDAKPQNGEYIIKTEKGDFCASSVIFATGLYSGGAKLGCDGAGLNILKKIGYKTVRTTPAIVQLRTENTVTRALKGIKIDAAATLLIGGKEAGKETGEVLFCDYGLSGPPILALAREVERQPGEKTVCLDLMPDRTESEVADLLTFLKNALAYRNLDEYLSGALNKRVGQAIIKAANLKLSALVSTLNADDIKKIAGIIKCFSFKVLSTTGFDNSQVTAGGLDTSEFDFRTMMSKKHNNLYAVGEILDIDGDCGGYNLHFAFSSAFCAADNILKEYRND